MEIVVGGAKWDKEPVGPAAASPRRRKEIAWKDHHRRGHLAVAVTATARQLDGPCE